MNARRHNAEYVHISGRQPVSEALSGGWPVSEVFIREGAMDGVAREIASKASSLGVKVSMVEARSFDRRYPRQSQGVAATVQEVPLQGVDEVLGDVPAGESPFFVALDGIVDPHNLGAIVRTALAMGVHGVVVPRHRTAPIGEGAAKSSAGAVFREPICEVPNIHYFIEWAKRNGLWVFGLDAAGQSTVWDADLAVPVALVVGSEGKGLARLTKDRCDILIRIPMSDAIGSLNASVACGIAIAEITRQRQQKASKRPKT